jgi:hypothetical protein
MLTNISEETAASIFRIKEQQVITAMTVTQTVGIVKFRSHERNQVSTGARYVQQQTISVVRK